MKTVPAWARVLGPPIELALNRLARWCFSIQSGESQTCPRRMGELGPWKRAEGIDFWLPGRWHSSSIVRDRWKNATNPRYSGGTKWPDEEPKPRTCSFCGGVHPDDAAALIRRGWTSEATDKSYKRYLEPPDGFSPVPPVKLYTMHFSPEQVAAFNAALDLAKLAKAG